ncbi:hypothetical protein F2P81_016346 [Scophthalmus maximus]|uniref:Uncharacterized protein n=1 Tax=Scophthalmus maximus TaxID=52904 RepID=A0A6A4SKX5_SCOMX|nr:hypothetical protein F2P81_016346 [Scophthalmus maximus]
MEMEFEKLFCARQSSPSDRATIPGHGQNSSAQVELGRRGETAIVNPPRPVIRFDEATTAENVPLQGYLWTVVAEKTLFEVVS